LTLAKSESCLCKTRRALALDAQKKPILNPAMMRSKNLTRYLPLYQSPRVVAEFWIRTGVVTSPQGTYAKRNLHLVYSFTFTFMIPSTSKRSLAHSARIPSVSLSRNVANLKCRRHPSLSLSTGERVNLLSGDLETGLPGSRRWRHSTTYSTRIDPLGMQQRFASQSSGELRHTHSFAADLDLRSALVFSRTPRSSSLAPASFR